MRRYCPMCKLVKEDMKAKGYCAPCHAVYVREWYQRNKDSIRNTQFQYKYGITIDDYNRMFQEQNGVCAICLEIWDHPRFKFMAVDHDEITGKVRALLCNPCNMGIGLLKHSGDIMQRAVDYLDLHNSRR